MTLQRQDILFHHGDTEGMEISQRLRFSVHLRALRGHEKKLKFEKCAPLFSIAYGRKMSALQFFLMSRVPVVNKVLEFFSILASRKSSGS